VRFLFILHNFFPEKIYGAEKVCISQMRELLRRGHEVGLFYSGNAWVSRLELFKNELDNLTLFRVKFINTRAQILLSACNPYVSMRFKKTLEIYKPDIIICHHLVRLSLDLPGIARGKGIPFIYYLHDFYLVCPSYALLRADGKFCPGGGVFQCARCIYESRFGQKSNGYPVACMLAVPFLIVRARMLKQFQSQTDLFISPSEFLLKEMNRRHFPAAAYRVLPNGSEYGRVHTERNVIKTVRFGYLGSTIKKKGVDVLMRAFEGEIGASLVIRGFPDEDALNRFRASYPDFKGKLEIFNSNIEEFYKNVDVVIVPSIWPENQPTVIIEAFGFGKPVICSDIGGMPEMVRHNNGGLLFKTGNAEDLRDRVVWLLENPNEVNRLAASIPQWLTIRENVDQLISEADALINRRRNISC
jgi:glycosyltransferase involved in cell wall biosynthesis